LHFSQFLSLHPPDMCGVCVRVGACVSVCDAVVVVVVAVAVAVAVTLVAVLALLWLFCSKVFGRYQFQGPSLLNLGKGGDTRRACLQT